MIKALQPSSEDLASKGYGSFVEKGRLYEGVVMEAMLHGIVG